MNRGRIAHVILMALPCAALAGAAWYWRGPLWGLFGEAARLREWVAGFGAWGPLVSIALNVAQVLLAPLPGQFLGLANGYLYGLWAGLFYNAVGLLLGTALAMGLARRFGRPLVERLVRPATLARWDHLAARQGPFFFFLVFLLPFLPDDVACFLIGLSPLPLPRMVIVATVARLPGMFVSCWMGAYAAQWPAWAWAPLLGGALALAVAAWRWRSPVEERLVGWLRALTARCRAE